MKYASLKNSTFYKQFFSPISFFIYPKKLQTQIVIIEKLY